MTSRVCSRTAAGHAVGPQGGCSRTIRCLRHSNGMRQQAGKRLVLPHSLPQCVLILRATNVTISADIRYQQCQPEPACDVVQAMNSGIATFLAHDRREQKSGAEYSGWFWHRRHDPSLNTKNALRLQTSPTHAELGLGRHSQRPLRKNTEAAMGSKP